MPAWLSVACRVVSACQPLTSASDTGPLHSLHRLVSIPTFVDLFAGCGGLSFGFHQAGYRCLLAVDSDPHAVKIHNHNLNGGAAGAAVTADLASLNSHGRVTAFLNAHGVQPGSCDVLIGGPPCQSFSVVGRVKVRALAEAGGDIQAYWEERNRTRTRLFEVYARFLEVLRPRWFLFENVPAIRSHPAYADIQQRFAGLKAVDSRPLHYRTTADIYLASSYGVPQHRRRFIMVGQRADLELPKWERPRTLAGPKVAQALDDLPAVPNGHRGDHVSYPVVPYTWYQRLMRSSPAGLMTTVRHHVCRTHNADDVALFQRMPPGGRFADPGVQAAIVEINPEHKLRKYAVDKFGDKLHRLDPDRSAWTVTAHLQKDCYKFIHHREARTITVREAARLQSFPDWFDFDDLKLGPAFRLIGNAVPPRMAQAFAECFLEADAELAERLRVHTPPLVSDELWRRLSSCFPERPAGLGRPRLNDRQTLSGILYVLRTGVPWEQLPATRGFGSGQTCRLRLAEWQRDGIWDGILHQLPPLATGNAPWSIQRHSAARAATTAA